jgi:hypothetical protein
MDNVIVSKALEDVSAISVKIIFGEIQMKNAMVSHKYFIGGGTFCWIQQNLISSAIYFTFFFHLIVGKSLIFF